MSGISAKAGPSDVRSAASTSPTVEVSRGTRTTWSATHSTFELKKPAWGGGGGRGRGKDLAEEKEGSVEKESHTVCEVHTPTPTQLPHFPPVSHLDYLELIQLL